MSSYFDMICMYEVLVCEIESLAAEDFRKVEWDEMCYHIASHKEDPASVATSFVQKHDKTGSISTGTNKDCGLTRFMWQAYTIYYRLRMHGPSDLRPLHLFKKACELAKAKGNAKASLGGKLLSSSFLLARFYAPGTGSRQPRDDYGFSEPTAFEKTMFIAMLFKVWSVTKRGILVIGKGTKRKYSDPLPNFKADRSHSQRIGSVVQSVIRAWDDYARFVGYRDCEDMVLPYITLSEQLQFEPIRTRSEGYSPATMKGSLEARADVAPSTDSEKVPEFVTVLSDEEDEALRSVSSMFLEDLDNLIVKDELYKLEEKKASPQVAAFYREHGKTLPPRFDEIDENLTSVIKKVNRSAEADDEAEVELIHSSDEEQEEDEAVAEVAGEVEAASAPPVADEEMDVVSQDFINPRSDPVGAASGAGTAKCPPSCTCPEAVAAEDSILSGVLQHVRVHCCSFEGFMDAEDVTAPEAIEGTAQLVLSDPPFNYRRENERDNSWYDSLSEDDMKNVGGIIADLLRKGGHGILFTSPIQFSTWYKILCATVFEEEDGSHSKAFNVDPEPIVMVRYPGHYKNDPSRKTTMLQGICDYAIHMTRTGETTERSHRMVDYNPQGFVSSRHKGWTNVIDNMERLTPGEKVRGLDGSILRNEQKARAGLMELISRFSRPGDVVVDLFAGTFSTAAACLELPKPRVFAGCELDDEAVQLGKRHSIIPVLVRRIQEGGISCSDEVRQHANFLMDHRNPYASFRIHDPSWMPPPGLPAYQTVPSHLLNFLATASGYSKFSTDAKNAPVSSWTPAAIAQVQSTDPRTLLAVECVQLGLSVEKSRIRHPDAGLGVFARRTIAEGEVIAHYYGALVYDNISTRPQRSKLYGLSGMLGVDSSTFKRKAISLTGPHPGEPGAKWPANYYIVPAPFCVAGFVNDPEYMDGDEEIALSRDENTRRTANSKIKSRRTHLPEDTVDEMVKYTQCYVIATRKIKYGEEIYFSYNRKKYNE